MTCKVDVECPIGTCHHIFEYECETEDSGDGSEHVATCPECKRLIHFEISYVAIAGNEVYKG